MPTELRNLTVKKIALVRKGYRPKNDGARITVVKAQQEEPVTQTTSEQLSLADRMVKALQSVFGSQATEATSETTTETTQEAQSAVETAETTTETSATTEDVSKAKTATQQVTDQGEHGEMTGMHAHDHTHSTYAADGTQSTYTHSHEHVHSGGSDHYHDYRPSHDGPDPVAKAQLELSAKVDALVARLDAADVVSKAALGEEKVGELIAASLATALEPVAKALEDIGIEKARLPLTPAVTQTIAPRQEPAAKAAEKAEAVKDMSFGDALRTLLHT